MISLYKNFGDLQALFNYTKFYRNFFNIEKHWRFFDSAWCVLCHEVWRGFVGEFLKNINDYFGDESKRKSIEVEWKIIKFYSAKFESLFG